jgi:hypothetical protein
MNNRQFEVLKTLVTHVLVNQERILNTMATQADVDVISQELQDAFDGIHAGFDELNAEIATLQAAQGNGEAIDLTALKAKADALKGLVPTTAPAIPVSTEPGTTTESGETASA